MDYSLFSTPSDLHALVRMWTDLGVQSVAIDFEEESNLHCYGEHVCIIQIYDKVHYYIVDAIELAKTQEGLAAMKSFLEGPIEKIMFACQSDAALARKTLGIQLNNVFDVRVIAMALGFKGNLTSLIERNLGLRVESSAMKKRYQTANWMRRPIPEQQIEYALTDVRYLFELKKSLIEEMEKTLSKGEQNKVRYEIKVCALQKNPERPGWEKICNFKLLNESEKVYIKHFFLARDSLARKAKVPASRILEKQLIVAMARKGTWDGVIPEDKMQYSAVFEKARLEALAELG